MNNEPEDPTGVIILDRGMNRDECKAMCTSPQIPLREKLFFRMIYETTTRPREVLEARIELWNRNTGEITFPKTKSKYNRWTRRHIPGAPKTMKLTSNTSEMLRHGKSMEKIDFIYEHPPFFLVMFDKRGGTALFATTATIFLMSLISSIPNPKPEHPRNVNTIQLHNYKSHNNNL